MSQTTTRPDDDSTDSNNDTDSLAPVLTDELATIREVIDSVSGSDVADMSDAELVEVWSELKELESTVEDARKDVVESELADRVEPGERLHGVSHIQSHRKYVDEDAGAVIMRAVSSGLDYTEFVSLDASALADAPIDVEIGRSEYTYFR